MDRARIRRWGLWGGIALLLAALLVLIFRPRPLAVETARVTRAPLEVTVGDEGETRIHDRFVIAAPVAGRVERIDLEAGDPVQRGEVIARLQPAPLDPRERQTLEARIQAAATAQREAAATVARTRTAWEQAERNRRRALQLAEAQVISRQQQEDAESEAESALRAWQAARFAAQTAAFQVREARAGLLAAENVSAGAGQVLAVRAPVAGRIFRLLQQSERVVPAGTTLVELGDPANLEVVVDLLSPDATRVHAADPVWIENWGGDHPLRGSVRYVEPSGFTKISALGIEEQRVNVIIDLSQPPPSLGDGFRVEARIVVWRGQNILQVPTSALFRRGEYWNVFTIENRRARLRRVTIGHGNPEATEVLQGLQPGETVVAYPSTDLGEGMRVTPRPEAR